jgi:3-hydroxyethyl bacteriochlorophyllide a dehydrogenase
MYIDMWMLSLAVVLPSAERVELRQLTLTEPGAEHVVVEVEWTSISTGTERLLWSGQMPPFPGMGYPLVPGYEAVGRVVGCGANTKLAVGDRVFVPGASCFVEARGLFGGAASRLVVPEGRVTRIDEGLGEKGVLFALAATALHALAGGDGRAPELIVGHGVLGRVLARLAVAQGHTPVVWEKDPQRSGGAQGYRVIDPASDPRRDYRSIYDVSGDTALLDTLLGRMVRGGEVVLAGFYPGRLSFDFPAAFMREARLRIAAEWQPEDMKVLAALVSEGRLDLDGLITHRMPFDRAPEAYVTAFTDPACLKMLVDWRNCS